MTFSPSHAVIGVFALLTAAMGTEGYCATVRTVDALSAEAQGVSLSGLSVDGRALPGVSLEAVLLDPETGEATAADITLEARWSSEEGCLRCTGTVRAGGDEDRVADLCIRVHGVTLPLSTMDKDPLLLPAKLLGKLPVVGLRVGEEDCLALAIPPDDLAVYRFSSIADGFELRYPLGLTADARPELRMQAPFSFVLYRTEPRWHFRSALEGYYRLFPESFEPFIREQGGWFFAAPTADLPNPQHFHYHEGGPGGWDADQERGMGTYPYRESSSYTVSLSGSELPKSYEEAMERFNALAEIVTPKSWDPNADSEPVKDVAHSGERSLFADNSGGGWSGARQTVTLPEPVEEPIVVEGFSRAQDVSGVPDHDYSIYVDVVYADGDYLFGQCAVFTPGTHDWERATHRFVPEKPVTELRVYCILRTHTGKAWFDDVRIGPEGEPEVNWIQNPGFEELSRRTDLQYIHDNVCLNADGRYVFGITDNLSADVGPSTPMNLLRFTLNVDPEIPSSEEKPAVAAREFDYYDNVFSDLPEVDGCYIDSVSAWCYGVLNGRREHWPYNARPFTYAPGSFKVVAAGRFAMTKYLRALQERYHPLGKPIFTNIHVNLEAFPLYLVSDVPGIESSQYRDEDSMFFYRASSYHKPLLLLNFVNLHGLDQRDLAELYHLNAAQWGEYPSTGRFVQQAYSDYGDVTHAYMESIKEISLAGWEPCPLAEGARIERFGTGDAVYFTLRAPQEAAQETVRIEGAAVGSPGEDLVAYDAVRLSPVPITREADGGCSLTVTHGEGLLTILRLSGRAQVAPWLLDRARRHALYAGRVQGKTSETPQILGLQETLAREIPTDEAGWSRLLSAAHSQLQPALASITGPEDDLFARSQRTEIKQARHALAELATMLSGAELSLDAPRVGFPGEEVSFAAAVGATGAPTRLVALAALPGRSIVPSLELEKQRQEQAPASVSLTPERVGATAVSAVFAVQWPADCEWLVQRLSHAFAVPPATVEVRQTGADQVKRSFTATVRRKPGVGTLRLRAAVEPEADLEPRSVELAADRTEAVFSVAVVDDSQTRALQVSIVDDGGNVLSEASSPAYWDEAPLPEHNVALAAAGSRCTTDSSYSGYDPSPLTDGMPGGEGLHWTKQAWASQDSGKPHFAEVVFDSPREVSAVWVYWSTDGGAPKTSQHYEVLGLTEGAPVSLAKVDGQPEASVSKHQFAPTLVRGIRIEQAEKGGPTSRPGIMWIREIAAVGQ